VAVLFDSRFSLSRRRGWEGAMEGDGRRSFFFCMNKDSVRSCRRLRSGPSRCRSCLVSRYDSSALKRLDSSEISPSLQMDCRWKSVGVEVAPLQTSFLSLRVLLRVGMITHVDCPSTSATDPVTYISVKPAPYISVKTDHQGSFNHQHGPAEVRRGHSRSGRYVSPLHLSTCLPNHSPNPPLEQD
jgi:hypothetical protein